MFTFNIFHISSGWVLRYMLNGSYNEIFDLRSYQEALAEAHHLKMQALER